MSRRGLLDGSTLSIESLRTQINQWRTSRTSRGRMSRESWAKAASLAREHGVYAISRALKVTYDSLKKHASSGSSQDGAKARAKRPQAALSGFVELGPAVPMGGTRDAVTLELVGSSGNRMTVRVASGCGLDVAELAREFWSYAGRSRSRRRCGCWWRSSQWTSGAGSMRWPGCARSNHGSSTGATRTGSTRAAAHHCPGCALGCRSRQAHGSARNVAVSGPGRGEQECLARAAAQDAVWGELTIPARLLCLKGQAPISGKIWELQRLRCNTCGEVLTAEPPEAVGNEKYDASVGVVIALTKYGVDVPFYRLGRLEQAMGIPFPLGHAPTNGIPCASCTGHSVHSIRSGTPRILGLDNGTSVLPE